MVNAGFCHGEQVQMEIKGCFFFAVQLQSCFFHDFLLMSELKMGFLPGVFSRGSHQSCSRCGKFKITLNCIWLGRCGRQICKAPSVMFHWKSWTFPKNSPHISVTTPPQKISLPWIPFYSLGKLSTKLVWISFFLGMWNSKSWRPSRPLSSWPVML